MRKTKKINMRVSVSLKFWKPREKPLRKF
jgi:hypothetical protein